MKKIVFSLIVTFTVLILSNNESIAQCTSCPGNTTPTAFAITLKTGCTAYIHYCYDCAPTGNPIAQFCMISLPNNPNCNGITIDAQFWKDVRDSMMINLATNCSNIWGQVPPCSTSTFQSLEIVVANCMEVIEDPNDAEIILIRPCDAEPGLCSKEYEVCWDGDEWVSTVTSVNFEPGECDYLPFELDIYSLPSWCTSVGCE